MPRNEIICMFLLHLLVWRSSSNDANQSKSCNANGDLLLFCCLLGGIYSILLMFPVVIVWAWSWEVTR
jgi:hypothetical protein